MIHILPVALEGTHVRVEPLGLQHENDLVAAAQPLEIWEFLTVSPRRTHSAMHDWLMAASKEIETTQTIWFAIVRRSDDRAVGVTSYMDIRPTDRGLEIGGTWLTPEVWRTALNTECKYLLLCHAFETLGCLRVQLKTDLRNVRSQRAIERLGAVKEGILRKHMVIHDGYVRDTVMYSIVDTEWPDVKKRLEEFLK